MVAWPDLPEHGGRRFVPRPSLPRAFGVLLGLGAVTSVMFLVGFVLFVHKLARIEPPAAPQADGIVALARMQVETRPSEIRVGGSIGPSASLHKP